MHGHNIMISNIVPEGSIYKICGKPAPWQMYCKDCGHILRFYCDEHAYLSQGTEKIDKHVTKAYIERKPLKMEKEIQEAKDEWEAFLIKEKKH